MAKDQNKNRDNRTGKQGLLFVDQELSEGNQGEKEPWDSNRIFHDIIDFLPDATFMIDRNGKVIAWNKAMEQMTKVPKEDMIGKGEYEYAVPFYGKARPLLADLTLLPDEEFEKIHYEGVYRQQGDTLYAAAYVPKTYGGKGAYLSATASRLRDASGRIIGAIESIRDITERKRAEEALRNSEKLLRDILDGSPIPQFVIGTDHRIILWNKAIEKYTGVKATEIVGTDQQSVPFYKEKRRTMADFLVDGSVEKIPQWYAGKYAKSQLVEEAYEGTDFFPALGKDGKWLYFTAAAIKDSTGTTIGAVETLEDITEHKRTDELLMEREEFLSSIIENIPDMIFIKDAKDLRFIRFNRAGENLLGFKREELIGKSDYDFFPREQADFFTKNDREVLDSGQPCDIPEEPIASRSGKRILHTQKIPIPDKDGNPAYLLGISEDITERKRAEEEQEMLQAQFSQAQKMESIGRLAGGVAHDFNNMLGVIIGYTEMAFRQVDPSHPVFAKLQQIGKAAERSADLTRQLLAFARKQTIIPKVLDLNETLEGMLKILRRLIGEDIDLTWQPGKGLWPVNVDPSQIDQILANLCVNASDAIAGVGKIIIETGNTSFQEAYCTHHPDCVPGDYVLLAVSDDGCGMEKKVLDNLFEPFFTTKETGKGTGLGLATVYGIVKQNNGFISVYSEEGIGSTFKIYLPRYQGEIEEIQEEGLAEPARGNETILVVEDDPLILNMTIIMLQGLGYTVLSASRPDDAIRIAGEHAGEIHLLLTDVIMPQMNGRDLAKSLTSLFPQLKCLFMSGYTADLIAHHGVLDDNVDFVQKPFSMHALAAKLRETLDKK
ncbi:PAS domain S-box-containing protein [Syntrophus gentianae]|uniref:histidine kinase n=1 Tax=Syntrophus gentianae TaxID=43775 RepID=A0A1H7W3P1_9BACT|nr:PAS domain-containing sensor histidine kinase [Syntrophus gentianae]SEM16091.1 PAS domain S-box-containing protein [Syntrophus gentianae]